MQRWTQTQVPCLVGKGSFHDTTPQSGDEILTTQRLLPIESNVLQLILQKVVRQTYGEVKDFKKISYHNIFLVIVAGTFRNKVCLTTVLAHVFQLIFASNVTSIATYLLAFFLENMSSGRKMICGLWSQLQKNRFPLQQPCDKYNVLISQDTADIHDLVSRVLLSGSLLVIYCSENRTKNKDTTAVQIKWNVLFWLTQPKTCFLMYL